MKLILLVEDDAALARGLADNLRFEGWTVLHVATGEAALERSRGQSFDLVVLDLMLPKLSGFDVLRALATVKQRPRVLVLSARDAEADVVRALDLGAADYVKKPFALAELLARVRAQLRDGSIGAAPPEPEFTFGDVRVSFARFRLWKGTREHLLSHHELAILRTFAKRPDQPITRAQILDEAWGEDEFPTERTVDNFVVKLRRKIESEPESPRFLLTVHGVGYRFDPNGGASRGDAPNKATRR
ncbi:MAG: response regulator transcription factor [Planctomycetes bacterium]|nr:response regulator transcription factor [Planctomycetota bacterium]MCC7173199.1 response regulator transcription factor [Planctomycetota bacterium]